MSKEIKKESFLTTIDNPFDPFTKFNEWYRYDCDAGYNTCALIDRIAQNNFENISTLDLNENELLFVFKRIIQLIPNVYKIVTNETLIEEIPINDIEDTE